MPSIKKKDYELLQHRATLYEEARIQCEVLDAEIVKINSGLTGALNRLEELAKSYAGLERAHDDLLGLYSQEVRRSILLETQKAGAEELSKIFERSLLREYAKNAELETALGARVEYDKTINRLILERDEALKQIAEKDKKIKELTLELDSEREADRLAEIPTCLKPYDAIEWAANLPEDIREDCQAQGFFDKLKRRLKWK